MQNINFAHNKQAMKLNINFPYASKHCKKRLSFYIPKYMHKLFDKYKKQLADHGSFLRNWNDKEELMIEERLGLKEKSFTAHLGRSSGAPNPVGYKIRKAASEKKANSIERRSATKRKAGDNNTVCSDDSNNSSNINNDDYSKTDQMEETPPSTFPAAMLCNNKQQKQVKTEVTNKQLPDAFSLPPAVPMIALTFSEMLKNEFSKLALGHLNISNCTVNQGIMTMETRQVEISKSPTHLPVTNISMH
eukprot:14594941-Ditylum_brightwellii.AAC.1